MSIRYKPLRVKLKHARKAKRRADLRCAELAAERDAAAALATDYASKALEYKQEKEEAEADRDALKDAYTEMAVEAALLQRRLDLYEEGPL